MSPLPQDDSSSEHSDADESMDVGIPMLSAPGFANDQSAAAAAAVAVATAAGYVTIQVGRGDIVPGFDRLLRREDLGRVIEAVVSPELGFGPEAHVSRDGVTVSECIACISFLSLVFFCACLSHQQSCRH